MDFALENVRLTGHMENVDIVGCLKSPMWQELRFICGKSLVFQEKMVPCGSREAVVTVISYENGIMSGYLQHPRLDKKEKLQSLSQMVLLLNSLMDLENCPNPPPPFVHPEYNGEEGKEVFRIQILFREHYTLQGKFVWQNEKREFVFHSVLELLQLLDEILAE